MYFNINNFNVLNYNKFRDLNNANDSKRKSKQNNWTYFCAFCVGLKNTPSDCRKVIHARKSKKILTLSYSIWWTLLRAPDNTVLISTVGLRGHSELNLQVILYVVTLWSKIQQYIFLGSGSPPRWRLDGSALSDYILHSFINPVYSNSYLHHLVR